jgi:hypothetical protein
MWPSLLEGQCSAESAAAEAGRLGCLIAPTQGPDVAVHSCVPLRLSSCTPGQVPGMPGAGPDPLGRRVCSAACRSSFTGAMSTSAPHHAQRRVVRRAMP